MEKQKENKLNWALTVDSEEDPISYKISGKTNENLGWGKIANVLYVLVTFRLSKVLNTMPRYFIYEVFILRFFKLALVLSRPKQSLCDFGDTPFVHICLLHALTSVRLMITESQFLGKKFF